MLITALLALLWIILGLLALVLVLSATPIVFSGAFQSEPEQRFVLTLAVFGGYAPPVTLVDSLRRTPKHASTPRRKSMPVQAKWARVLPNAPRLLKELLSRFRLHAVTANVRFGLHDPADTGTVYGLLCPFDFGLPQSHTLNISVTPDFDRPCLDGRIEAVVSVVPLRLVRPVFGFLLRSFAPWGQS